MRIYLDHHATTPLDPRVAQEMLRGGVALGNPSSIHAEGRRARAAIDHARDLVAGLCRVDPYHVIFTSGGTEANAIGLQGLATAPGQPPGSRGVALCSGLEHPSVGAAIRACSGLEVVEIPCDGDAGIDPEILAQLCERHRPQLVAVAAVNHELGTVAEIEGLAQVAHEAGARFHCDAVAAAGRVDLERITRAADTVAVSAHKIYGPMGVGALILGQGVALAGSSAGHQERGLRPGTENTLGIVGFGVAAELALREGAERKRHLEVVGARLQEGLEQIDGVTIHGRGRPRVGGTVNAGFAGCLGEVLVRALDLEGVAASTGAACSSGSVAPSKVLLALGVTEEVARTAVRFSAGKDSSLAEIDRLLEILPPIVARARTCA